MDKTTAKIVEAIQKAALHAHNRMNEKLDVGDNAGASYWSGVINGYADSLQIILRATEVK